MFIFEGKKLEQFFPDKKIKGWMFCVGCCRLLSVVVGCCRLLSVFVAVVELTPFDQEVVSSNPFGYLAFYSSFSFSTSNS